MNRCQCGETIVEVLFNLPRCINPRCRFFDVSSQRRFIFESEPIHKKIDEFGWVKPFFLGSFGDLIDGKPTTYDLWFVEPEEGAAEGGPGFDACFVAQHGDSADKCYWHPCIEVRDSDEIQDTFPELREAMRRFDAISS